MDNGAAFPCDDCNGLGELSHSRGNQGFICETCRGTGARLCQLCMQLPAVDCVDGNYACAECLPLTVSDVCWTCLSDTPIAMHSGLALCGRCFEEASLRSDTDVPPAPDTIPCPANDTGEPEVEDPDTELRMRQLMASAELIEDARAVGWTPHEAFRAVRRGLIAKGNYR